MEARFLVVAGAALALLALPVLAGDPSCVAKWEQAEAAGIIHGFGFAGATPTVVVDEPTWNSIDYTVKVGMAATFECAVVDAGESLARIDFVSNRTNKVLAEWRFGKLTVK